MRVYKVVYCLLLVSFLLISCKKEKEEHYLEGVGSIPLKEVIYTVELPNGIAINEIKNYTISNAYGDYPITVNNSQNKISAIETDTLGNHSKVKVFENGSYQLIYLNDEFGNPVMVDVLKINGSLIKVNEFSANTTALAILMTHPLLITTHENNFERIKGNLKSMPSFNAYSTFVSDKIIASIKYNVTPDFTSTPLYKKVVLELLNRNMQNFDIPVGTMELNLQKRNMGEITYSLINEHKRVLHFYSKKAWLDNNGIEITDEPFQMFEDVNYENIGVIPRLDILLSKDFSFWESTASLFQGEKMSVFKTESYPVKLDLDNADQLKVEIYGLGKLDKPFSELDKEDQIKFLMVAFHGVYEDFISPMVDLAIGVKNISKEQKYDFRYGSRKAPFIALFKSLLAEFNKDVLNVTKAAVYIDNEDYLGLSCFLSEFVILEILGDKQSPEVKRRYLNHIYNIYKKYSGVSSTDKTFRDSIKKGMRKIALRFKIIELSEAGGNIVGAVHAYYNTPYKDVKYINKTSAQEIKLISPQQDTNIISGDLSFDWSFDRGEMIGPVFYNVIIKEKLPTGVEKEHKIEDLIVTQHILDISIFNSESHNFSWKVEVRRLNSEKTLLQVSDSWQFTIGEPLAEEGDIILNTNTIDILDEKTSMDLFGQNVNIAFYDIKENGDILFATSGNSLTSGNVYELDNNFNLSTYESFIDNSVTGIWIDQDEVWIKSGTSNTIPTSGIFREENDSLIKYENASTYCSYVHYQNRILADDGSIFCYFKKTGAGSCGDIKLDEFTGNQFDDVGVNFRGNGYSNYNSSLNQIWTAHSLGTTSLFYVHDIGSSTLSTKSPSGQIMATSSFEFSNSNNYIHYKAKANGDFKYCVYSLIDNSKIYLDFDSSIGKNLSDVSCINKDPNGNVWSFVYLDNLPYIMKYNNFTYSLYSIDNQLELDVSQILFSPGGQIILGSNNGFVKLSVNW